MLPDVDVISWDGARRVTRAATWSLMLMLFASACGGGGEEAEAGSQGRSTTTAAAPAKATTPPPTTTERSKDGGAATQAPTPATPVPGTAAPATTAAPSGGIGDLFAVTDPVPIAIDWNCDDQLVERSGFLVLACTSGRIEPWFSQTNWFISVMYVRDDDGAIVGLEGAASGYNASCMWSRAEDASLYTAPVVDGKATIEGLLFGNGHCEGLQFVFSTTWDVDDLTSVTEGTIERTP